MPDDQLQKIYATILDTQKQVGAVSREMGEQTEKLISIEKKVNYTNGTVNKHSAQIKVLQLINATDNGKNSVRTAIFSACAGVLLTLLAAFVARKLGL